MQDLQWEKITKKEDQKDLNILKKNDEQDDQEEHGHGMRPPMGKHPRPTMGKHQRPPMGKNQREEGPEGSEHFEGKNDEQEDIKAMAEQFQQVQEKFELIF